MRTLKGKHVAAALLIGYAVGVFMPPAKFKGKGGS